MFLYDLNKFNSIKLFLKEQNIQYNDKFAILNLQDYVLKFPFHSNLVYLVKQACLSCPVDCYKKYPIQFNDKFDKEIGKIKKIERKNNNFNEIEIEYLSRILLLNDKPEKYFDFEKFKILLEENLTRIEFYIMGRRDVGKETIFNLITGKNNEGNNEWKSKIIESFPPLKILIFNVNSNVFEKNYIPPYIQNELFNAYMFIIISNSTTKSVLDIKNVFIPLLKRINPDTLQICIANMQDKEHVMSGESIENLTNLRTYEFIAINSDFKERIMNILFETILIRIDQMKENDCYLFDKNFTTTSQL